MKFHKLLCFFFFFFLFCLLATGYNGEEGVKVGHNLKKKGRTKLFVFGDSYVDTGNDKKTETLSWTFPYGVTFPGKPTGRFSDGRVLTDFIARDMRIRSPIPYEKRIGFQKLWRYGMNFAYGGTGVFRTGMNEPNMTTQIRQFHHLLNKHPIIYSKKHLKSSSFALATISGNDYSYYLSTNNNSIEGIIDLIPAIVDQLAINLKSIYDLGLRKIVVTSLQPLGCLPRTTFTSSFKTCNSTVDLLVQMHNSYLYAAVAKLNNDTRSSSFVILDLYSAFNTVLLNNTGTIKFETPLKPCCVGVGNNGYCGIVENGTRLYNVCTNRNSSFFWDMVHPTQAAWTAVSAVLRPAYKQIIF